MQELEFYNEAKNYLLSFDTVTAEMLDAQLTEQNHTKPKDIQELFKRMLVLAQSRQGMPHSIGGEAGIEELSDTLFNYDHQKVREQYKSWGDLFDALHSNQSITRIQNTDKNNRRNNWVIYCQAILSICDFLSPYKNLEEFNAFTADFLKYEHGKCALPLLVSSDIFGFGFALACDFLKENISPDFVKPDTQLNYIAKKLGITNSKTDYHIFKDIMNYCRQIDKSPYEVDALFTLIGSGHFTLSDTKIESSKSDFVAKFSKN